MTGSDHDKEDDDQEDEEDLEKLQAEIDRMEAEAARITKETEQLNQKKDVTADSAAPSAPTVGGEAKDGFSIYVGQVDYTATPEDLLGHFQACGTVERVTIVCDKMTGRPKGYAYLEFQTEEAVENAVKLDGSDLKGRSLKVAPKRVNVAGFHVGTGSAGGRGGGRGGRAGGRHYRGGYRGGGGRGRGGRFSRGGGGGYHPYY